MGDHVGVCPSAAIIVSVVLAPRVVSSEASPILPDCPLMRPSIPAARAAAVEAACHGLTGEAAEHWRIIGGRMAHTAMTASFLRERTSAALPSLSVFERRTVTSN